MQAEIRSRQLQLVAALLFDGGQVGVNGVPLTSHDRPETRLGEELGLSWVLGSQGACQGAHPSGQKFSCRPPARCPAARLACLEACEWSLTPAAEPCATLTHSFTSSPLSTVSFRQIPAAPISTKNIFLIEKGSVAAQLRIERVVRLTKGVINS